ncbi:unnamed protein product [Heterobilharzia americana]|nr:unnamed protein product [Heterobilharzia americana]
MLKASPTHEFQSTTSLQYSSPNAKPLPDVTKPVCKKRAQVPVVSPKREPDNSEFQPRCEEKSLISNSVISKVLSVVVHLRESRRRPIQEVVLALCQKHHDISEDVVLSSLDILVSRGHLHRVESDKGISYRSNPFVVARGDLKPATLSAKIKAKYTGGANERRSKVASSVLVGSKRPHSERSSNHCQSKVARNDPTTNTYQRYSRRSATKSLIASDSSAPNCSCNSDINEKIYFNQSSVIVDNMQMNRDHVHPDKGDYLASIKSPSHELQQGTKIFIVPPASPLNEATFESQMNNLPCHRTEQSGQGSCNTASSLSGYSFQNPGIPQIADSRRSNRQMINHRFRSICVKKNVQGRFTEVWLQSPGSSLKMHLPFRFSKN